MLHSLNANEFNEALNTEFAEDDARLTKHFADVKANLLDGVAKIKSERSIGDALVLESVDNLTSFRLRYAQLRLPVYRSTSRAEESLTARTRRRKLLINSRSSSNVETNNVERFKRFEHSIKNRGK